MVCLSNYPAHVRDALLTDAIRRMNAMGPGVWQELHEQRWMTIPHVTHDRPQTTCFTGFTRDTGSPGPYDVVSGERTTTITITVTEYRIEPQILDRLTPRERARAQAHFEKIIREKGWW